MSVDVELAPLTRAEVLALALPVERVFDDSDIVVRTRGRERGANYAPVVFRYATREAADAHLRAERDALRWRSTPT